MVHEGRAALCGRPFPVAGRFPCHPVGEGLAPPAGFRNFSGQRWNFALWDGAPGRRALRAAWSAEGGRVRRPAPTGCQTKYSKTGQREGQAPPLRGGRERFPGRGQAGTWGVVLGAACSGHCGRIGVPDSHPLPRLVGNRRGCGTISTEILHCIRAQWPGRNETRNRILRAGTFAEGRRGIPRKRGTGGGATMGGDAHRSPPPAAFCLLCRRGQRRSPRRAKPCEVRRAESSRPTGVMVHGGRAATRGRPYGDPRPLPRYGGRGKPPPLRGERGNISWWRIGGRPQRAAPTGWMGKRRMRKKHKTPPLPD